MNVLIAVDLSEITMDVLTAVRKLPFGGKGKLFLMHVAEPDPAFVGWDAGPEVVRNQMAGEFHREHQELTRLADELRAAGHDVTALLVQGPTVATLLREAEQLQADLIVVGSHGRGAAYDLLVGSISSGVIRSAPVPVLVIPSPRAPRPDAVPEETTAGR